MEFEYIMRNQANQLSAQLQLLQKQLPNDGTSLTSQSAAVFFYHSPITMEETSKQLMEMVTVTSLAPSGNNLNCLSDNGGINISEGTFPSSSLESKNRRIEGKYFHICDICYCNFTIKETTVPVVLVSCLSEYS